MLWFLPLLQGPWTNRHKNSISVMSLYSHWLGHVVVGAAASLVDYFNDIFILGFNSDPELDSYKISSLFVIILRILMCL